VGRSAAHEGDIGGGASNRRLPPPRTSATDPSDSRDGEFMPGRITVVLVDEVLGF
jgi:hypothetical protein